MNEKVAPPPPPRGPVKQPLITDNGADNKFDLDESKSIFSGCSFVVTGDRNRVRLADGVKLFKTRVIVTGNDNVLSIDPGALIDGNKLIINGNGSAISIGREFRSNDGTILTVKEDGVHIRIGIGCLFSTNISIRTSDNHGIFSRSTLERINIPASVEIGDRVWVGEDAKLLKGCRIGNDTVIGASAIVTGEIPANVVAVGAPARVLRKDVFWYKHTKLPRDFDLEDHETPDG